MSLPIDNPPDWSDLRPFATVVGNEGFPPELLPGDTIICRGDFPPEVTPGVLALVNVEILGRVVTLVRRVHVWRGKLVVMPDPRSVERPVVVMRDRLKVFAPVLEVRRRFEVTP